MKRIVAYICFIFLTLQTGFAEVLEATKFRVGVIAPLSGALAEYGLASKNGIELAVKDNPELFSNIDFSFEDSQWDPKIALSSFNKLVNVDKADIIYNWGNPTTEALAPVAEASKIPLIALTLDARVSLGKKYVIRTINRAEDFSNKLAFYLNSKKPKKIAIVLADNTYVSGLKDGLKASLPDDIKVDLIGPFAITEQDFRSAVLKIKQGHYDYVGVFLISGQISTFYRQMKSAKINLPTFGTDFFESSTEINLAQGAMEGAVYPHLSVKKDFYEKYVSIFKNDYQIAYAGNAFDMSMVIGQILSGQKVKQLPREQIVAKLKTINNFSGIGGSFSFKDSAIDGPHYDYKPVLKQILNNEIREIKE